MKRTFLVALLPACLCLASRWGASAAVVTSTFNSGFAEGGSLADGTGTPWTDTRTLSGIEGEITDISVRLDITGGFNGDLYAYLSHDGVLVPLLNRAGVGTGNPFGYGDSGLNVTFTDAAAHDIHTYQTVASYSISAGDLWRPDGRAISPVSAPAAFDAPGTTSLGVFSSLNPNGDWALVLADLSVGGGQTTVMSWGLDITTAAVPEPPLLPFGSAGVVLLAAQGVGYWVRSRRARFVQ